MLQLTKAQQEDIKDLIKKPGFKTMINIAEDLELSILRQFKNIDITNPNNLAILSKNTAYLKGIEDFMGVLKSGNNTISEKKLED